MGQRVSVRLRVAGLCCAALAVALLPAACDAGLAVGLQDKIELEEPSIPAPPVAEGSSDPLGITLAEAEYYSLLLTWEPATDEHLEQARLQYRLAAADTEAAVTGAAMHDADIWVDWSEGVTRFDTDSDDDAYENVAMTYGQEFWVNVAVRDRAGHTAYYTPTPVATTDDTDAPTPGELTVDTGSVGVDGFSVTWDAASDVDGLTPAADLMYKVVYTDAGSDALATLADAEANGTVAQDWKKGISGITIDGLIDQWTYHVAVFVRDNKGLVSRYPPAEAETEKLPRMFLFQHAPPASTLCVTDLDASSLEVIRTFTDTDDSEVYAMAIDHAERKLYWADANYGNNPAADPGAILRCNFDGSNVEEVITTNLPEPFGLAIYDDGTDRYLFWTDFTNNAIYQSPLPPPSTNAASYVILDTDDGVEAPAGIAVDPISKTLHWVQQAGTRFVGEAQIADPENTILNRIDEELLHQFAMAVNPDRDRVYWTSWSPGEIRSRQYNDGWDSYESLVTANLSTPSGIAVDPNTEAIYFTDLNKHKIYRLPLGSTETDAANLELPQTLTAPLGIAIY